MIDILRSNELLLLFLVIAIGYGVGNIKIKGTGLGVAAVLFVGLGFGALDASLTISNTVFLIGLVMFVYTIGLSNGPIFFKNFKRSGFRDILFVVWMLTLSASVTVGVHYLFGLDAAVSAGLFAGSTTNTPALAGLLDTISGYITGEAAQPLMQDAVVGYSLSYPMGVIGVMLAIAIMQRLLRINYPAESNRLRKDYPIDQQLEDATVEITNPDITAIPIRDLMNRFHWTAVFGRVKRGEAVELIHWDTRLKLGDKISLVASIELLNDIIAVLGVRHAEKLSDDRSEYDLKRIFVSNPQVVGKSLATLNLPQHFAAIISRVRRGDIDVLADGNTIVELGDRVRVIARRDDMPKLSKLFGDSYEALSHINLLSFGLGIALGLLLGMVIIELPGGIKFSLGFAGGPLVVALLLGSLRRTGSLVWTLPYSANLTLRQLGLILLLATVGIKSGHQFFATIAQGDALFMFLGGTIISMGSALITLFVGYKLVKIPFSFLTGMVANQPAILDFSLNQAGNRLPNFGFTMMFPVALILKIVYVQLLFVLLH